jgi:hypothetical protein
VRLRNKVRRWVDVGRVGSSLRAVVMLVMVKYKA